MENRPLKGMTVFEWSMLATYALDQNAYCGSQRPPRSPRVKYMDFSIDGRYGIVYEVRFWGYGIDVTFNTVHFVGKEKPEWFTYENLDDLVKDYIENKLTHEMLEEFVTEERNK